MCTGTAQWEPWAARALTFQVGVTAKAEQSEPEWTSSPGQAGMAQVGVATNGTRWPRQDPSRVCRQVCAGPLGRRAGEASGPTMSSPLSPLGFRASQGLQWNPGKMLTYRCRKSPHLYCESSGCPSFPSGVHFQVLKDFSGGETPWSGGERASQAPGREDKEGACAGTELPRWG